MTTTILKEVLAFLFGRKYYVFVYRYPNTKRRFCGSTIYATRKAMQREKESCMGSSLIVEKIVSFRSREHYPACECVRS